MLSFKQFKLILEGGNLQFDHNGQNRVSDSIDVKNREKEKPEFHNMFQSIDNGFKKQHGHSLFGNALKNNTFASGSSEIYNDPSVSTERLLKSKPTMGDYDVQVPEEHRKKLEEYLKPGQVHGKFTIHHVRTSGSQVHAIVKHNDTGKFHQIDFEPVEYDKEKQEPSAYEKFAHSSHINDLESGLKGVHHKLLAQSIFSAHSKPTIISKTTGRGKDKKEIEEEGNTSLHTFSVDKGVRQKWEKIGEKDGKDIVKEKATKDSTYTKHLPDIYKSMFNHEPSENDIKDIHSFGGLVDHIKKHIPQEHHKKIVDTFINKLWHPSAQATSIDPNQDKTVKEKAYEHLKKHFPAETSELSQDTEAKKQVYYADKKKFSRGEGLVSKDSENLPKPTNESESKHTQIAMTFGGLRAGPTKEHGKLIDKLLSQKADKHYVFVTGPDSEEKTSEREPLTVHEKIEHLQKLYPEHKDSFRIGINPIDAMKKIWREHQKEGHTIGLTVVAGTGKGGIDQKDKSASKNEGGSLENYKSLFDKYNGTTSPIKKDKEGNVTGGFKRMDYTNMNSVENPRGEISGSVVRKAMRESNPNDSSHIEKIKSMMHPNYTNDDIKDLITKVKSRSKISESLLLKIRRIVK